MYHLRVEAALDNVAVVIVAGLAGDECQVPHFDALQSDQFISLWFQPYQAGQMPDPLTRGIHLTETRIDRLGKANQIHLAT